MLRKKKDDGTVYEMINGELAPSLEILLKDAVLSGLWAELTSKAKTLYPVLLFFTNEAGLIFVDAPTLAKHSGLTKKGVALAIEELEKFALFVRDRELGDDYIRLSIPGIKHFQTGEIWQLRA
jgi:hypothetical protein